MALNLKAFFANYKLRTIKKGTTHDGRKLRAWSPFFVRFSSESDAASPRQTHEINAVRWSQVADRKNSPNRGIRRGRPLTSQTAFGGQLPYKGSLVRSVARFHHIPLSIMAGFYEPRASVMASAIHTSRGGTPFGRPLRYRIQAIKFYVAVCRICRGCPSGAARQRDFITSHSSIMAGFYEPRTTNHDFFHETRVTRDDVVILSLLPRSGI